MKTMMKQITLLFEVLLTVLNNPHSIKIFLNYFKNIFTIGNLIILISYEKKCMVKCIKGKIINNYSFFK